MKYLNVFEDVPIPVEYAATETYALLARRNGGKTYTTLLLEEQLCDAGLFFVTLDPVGKHWALRAGAKGSEQGGKRDVWVLGGQHGDVPLEPRSGQLIADTVVEHPGRYILDVSGFETDSDQDRFALDFGQRLFRRKAKDPGFPLLVILEEAESFIPERPQPGQTKLLGAYARIVRQGRNHGLGLWMVAQRSQALNKGVLSQAEVLIVKQTAHTRDRAAIDDWIKANGTSEQRAELMDSVASLEQNEAWVWSPSWLRCFTRTHVPTRVTFDSSASVRAGAEQRSIKLTPLDVDALGTAIAATAERAKADDPKELRKQITQLQHDLAKRPTETKTETVTETVEIPVLANGTVDRLEATASAIADAAAQLGEAAGEIRGELRRVNWRPCGFFGAFTVGGRCGFPDAEALAASQMLTVIAQRYPLVVTKAQLGTLAGFTPRGGTFRAYVNTLKRAGLIVDQSGEIQATQEGLDHLGEIPPAPQTTEELLDMWRRSLRAGERTMLDILVGQYPDSLTRDELGELAEFESSGGTFRAYLNTLRRNGLADVDGDDLRASDALFLEAVG